MTIPRKKKLKHCDIGNHDVPVLFHSRKPDRPSCCANCYRFSGKPQEKKKVPQKSAIQARKPSILESVIPLVDELNFTYLKLQQAVHKVRTQIKKQSDKEIKRLAQYRKVRDEYMREHPICEYPGCNNPSTDLHHGAGRQGKLLTDTRYFKALDINHHRWAEENPIEAKELGLSFNRLDKS